jgi:hypothetical protein
MEILRICGKLCITLILFSPNFAMSSWKEPMRSQTARD